MNERTYRKGISILEVLVVVVLVAVIVGMLLPALLKKSGEESFACRIACMDNAKRIGLALFMYAEGNDGFFPPAAGWNETVRAYALQDSATGGIFACPATKGSAGEQGLGYGMCKSAGGRVAREMVFSSEKLLIVDADRAVVTPADTLPAERHDGLVNVVFADGHVKAHSIEEIGSGWYDYASPPPDW